MSVQAVGSVSCHVSVPLPRTSSPFRTTLDRPSPSSRTSSKFKPRQTGSLGLCQTRKDVTSAFLDWSNFPVWIVRTLAERVYPANPCGDGMYYDPNQRACVYLCKPGYVYDPETKSCVRGGHCEEGYVYDATLHACVAEKGSHIDPVNHMLVPDRGLVEDRRSVPRKLASWVSRHVFGKDDCPVGFYHDPMTDACVPMCAPGYLYDARTKRCVPAGKLKHRMAEEARLS